MQLFVTRIGCHKKKKKSAHTPNSWIIIHNLNRNRKRQRTCTIDEPPIFALPFVNYVNIIIQNNIFLIDYKPMAIIYLFIYLLLSMSSCTFAWRIAGRLRFVLTLTTFLTIRRLICWWRSIYIGPNQSVPKFCFCSSGYRFVVLLLGGGQRKLLWCHDNIIASFMISRQLISYIYQYFIFEVYPCTKTGCQYLMQQ